LEAELVVRTDMLKAMRHLRPKYREALVLSDWFDLSTDECARSLGLQPSTCLADLPKVRDGDSTPRSITAKLSRDDQSIDTVVCMYGNISGYQCQLKSKNYDPPNACTATSDPNPTYMRVDDPDVEFGDSGGPVYTGPTAMGFEKGYVCDFGTGTSQYYYMTRTL
jgi:hypothetical protein